jgi:hypothetical protein
MPPASYSAANVERLTTFEMRLLLTAVLSAALLLSMVCPANAQIRVDFDLGVRGGAFNSGIPISVENNHIFRNLYTADNLPFTAGPTIGALLNNRWLVRFEAVRSQFRFHEINNGLMSVKETSVTDGQVWQYPLLLTYLMGSGPIRPFAGGGISFGSTFKGTARVFDAGVPTSTQPFKLESVVGPPVPLYITGGLESRVSFVSIRPELRYTHWTGFDSRSVGGSQDDTILFSANQFEFLLSVTVHPFPHRR